MAAKKNSVAALAAKAKQEIARATTSERIVRRSRKKKASTKADPLEELTRCANTVRKASEILERAGMSASKLGINLGPRRRTARKTKA